MVLIVNYNELFVSSTTTMLLVTQIVLSRPKQPVYVYFNISKLGHNTIIDLCFHNEIKLRKTVQKI